MQNSRRARFYRLTRAGCKLLEAETRHWEQTAAVIGRFSKRRLRIFHEISEVLLRAPVQPGNKATGDDRLREEITEYLALQTADNLRTGLSPAEARRQAVVKFGPTEAVREEYWAERGLAIFEAVLWDLRFGWRSLRKSRGFTAVAVVTLALHSGWFPARDSPSLGLAIGLLFAPGVGRLVGEFLVGIGPADSVTYVG